MGIPVSVPEPEGIPVSVLEGTPVSVPDGIPVSVLEGIGSGVLGPTGGIVRVKVVVTVSVTPPDGPLGSWRGGSGPAAAPANARSR